MYPELSSRRVLTMEYIDGIKVSDREKLKEFGFDRIEVARIIVKHLSDMIFVHGFVHMDPHAGNIFIRQNPTNKSIPQMVLIDHGMYTTMTEKSRLAICELWKGLLLRDEKVLFYYLFIYFSSLYFLKKNR